MGYSYTNLVYTTHKQINNEYATKLSGNYVLISSLQLCLAVRMIALHEVLDKYVVRK